MFVFSNVETGWLPQITLRKDKVYVTIEGDYSPVKPQRNLHVMVEKDKVEGRALFSLYPAQRCVELFFLDPQLVHLANAWPDEDEVDDEDEGVVTPNAQYGLFDTGTADIDLIGQYSDLFAYTMTIYMYDLIKTGWVNEKTITEQGYNRPIPNLGACVSCSTPKPKAMCATCDQAVYCGQDCANDHFAVHRYECVGRRQKK